MSIEELEKENKQLKEKNKALVEIVMKIFQMDPMKRNIVIEQMKQFISALSDEQVDAIIKKVKDKE